MTIKEVEQQTGLARSNIRFYEKEKLIEPTKNNSNGYKDYSQEDVDRIKRIAYLRTLGISVDDISSIISQKVSLYEVIKCQSLKLDKQITGLKDSKTMCDKMLQADTLNFDNLNIEEYAINANDYWKNNKMLLEFDSIGFLYVWSSITVCVILVFLSAIIAALSYSKLPTEIPVQWNAGVATSWVNKYFIFAFPIACVLIRFVLRPILYGKLRMYTSYVEMMTDYVSNSLCLVVLSIEVFSILFIVGLVKNIAFVLVAEAVIFLSLMFIGARKMMQ